MKKAMLFCLIVALSAGPLAFFIFLGVNADRVAASKKEACIARGGFPVSKGPRSYDYHCFKENPLLTP
jgi:hypothetical protein